VHQGLQRRKGPGLQGKVEAIHAQPPLIGGRKASSSPGCSGASRLANC
jgi:hypothetical protein